MEFTKMHGIGNDYVYINDIENKISQPEKLAQWVSNRNFGIGSDGLILIKPSTQADFFMRMYNADGSEGKMCGNGIRCFGKLVYDLNLTDQTDLLIETQSGIKELTLHMNEGRIDSATVMMGIPELKPSLIPIASDGDTFINQTITVDAIDYGVTGVSMGNPHIVTYVDSLDDLDLAALGPSFENHALFPERINTEFVKVIDENTLAMRVWERGSGETLACGTGACAVAVASVLNGHSKRDVTVKLLGGDLSINWDEATSKVFMSGPAVTVFTGILELENEEIYYG